MDKSRIIEGLDSAPATIADLISGLDPESLRIRRIPSKWSAHEHLCHLASVQPMFNARLEAFRDQAEPRFDYFTPAKAGPGLSLAELDLRKSLEGFSAARRAFAGMLRKLPAAAWDKQGFHPEYSIYTPYVMARHLCFHDNLHLYRVEELLITRDEYLPK